MVPIQTNLRRIVNDTQVRMYGFRLQGKFFLLKFIQKKSNIKLICVHIKSRELGSIGVGTIRRRPVLILCGMVWNGGRREIFRVQRPREFRCQCVHRQLIQDGDKRAEAACESGASEKNTAHTRTGR